MRFLRNLSVTKGVGGSKLGNRRRNHLRLSTTLFLATAVTAGRGFVPIPSLATTIATRTVSNMSNNNVVFEEGRGASTATNETSKEFLLNRPSGAYTTARTSANAKRIFEWEAHVERTANSLASMMEKESKESSNHSKLSSKLSDPLVLRKRLDAAVEEAVQLHLQNNGASPSQQQELKITVLVGWEGGAQETSNDAAGDSGWVACHVTGLPQIPSKPVRVEIRGSPRDNALAKDSAWVSDRAPLEALMQSASCGGPVNELLLANEQGQLLEGSQTNFYAVIDGAVWTAGEGILEGTVRGLLLDVCQKEGIPVILEPPNLDTLESWEGALISSTSRLALPIDQLYVPSEGLPSDKNDLKKEFDNESSLSIAAKLQRLVSLEVEARSTPIGEPVPI